MLLRQNKTYIIAEIGTSHNGDINKAKELIHGAKACGADCAKFQVVYADEILHKNTGIVKLPGGDTPLYEVFKSLEQPESFYKSLKDECDKIGINFMASPFGEKSARLLERIGSAIFKIASPELNHLPLIKEIASYNKPIILSSGVSRLEDIERAIEITKRCDVTLLHCITSYPAPPEDYNLSLIPNLKNILGIKTGVSDHSLDPILVPSISVLLGATVVEKHITISNETNGLDDPVALNLTNFKLMCDSIRKFELMDQQKGLNELKKIYGDNLIDKVIGDGVKRLAPSEVQNYGRTNRSLHALDLIKAGTVITKFNTALLRTEKVLRPGMPPNLVEAFYGKKVINDIPSGEGIRVEDFLG